MANEFQPSLSEQQTRQYADDLKKFPQYYNEQQKEGLRAHASYYNVPLYEGEFDLVDAVKQLAGGVVEGFTTVNFVDPPDNEYEAIIRNIGHLAGFAPGIASGPLKAIGAKGLAQTAARFGKASVPMLGADAVTKQAKKLVGNAMTSSLDGRSGAAKTAADFLLTPKAKHIMEGAFHLGAASAVSSWKGGVDVMMESFLGGAMAGGVFRGIGNLPLQNFVANEKGQKAVKAMAGSLFMGLHSTMQGATAPEQVYEYLMGAYFGGKETPWTKAKAGEFVNRMAKDMNKPGFGELKATGIPELHPKWKDLPTEVQPIVKQQLKLIYKEGAENKMAAYILARATGQDVEPPKDIINTKAMEQVLGVPKEQTWYLTADKPKEKIKTPKIKLEEQVDEIDVTSDVDLGMRTMSQVAGRSVNFVERHMKTAYKLPDVKNIQEKKLEVARDLDVTIQKYLTGTSENRTADVIKEMQTKHKVTLNEEAIGQVRQRMAIANQGKQATIIASDGVKAQVLKTTEGRAPMTLAGKAKRLILPETPFEKVGIWDHISRRDNGKFEDIELSKYKMYLQKSNTMTKLKKKMEGEGLEYQQINDILNRKINNEIVKTYKNTIESMAKKEKLLPLGGKGDKDMIQFVPEHKSIKKHKLTDFIKTGLSKSRADMKKKYGIDSKLHDKIMLNNILHDISTINGLDINVKNFNAIHGKYFAGIKNLVAWNKRQQIVMNTSYPADARFIRKEMGLKPGENLKFKVIADPPKLGKDKSPLTAKNAELPEAEDGGVVSLTKLVDVLNKDAGVPKSGHNKNFVFDNTHKDANGNPLGALMIKGMNHNASKAGDARLLKEGIHFELPESAAKQLGFRKVGGIYELDPSKINYTYSTFQGPEMIGNMKMVKQFATAATSLTKVPAPDYVVNEIFSKSEARFKGNEAWNNRLDTYLKNPTEEGLQDLMGNLNQIGIQNMLSAISKPGQEKLAQGFFSKVVNINEALTERRYQEGEITLEARNDYLQELSTFNSANTRKIEEAIKWSQENKNADYFDVFLMKGPKDYLQQALKNWISDAVITPEIPNSLVARMRPMDAEARKELPDLQGANYIKDSKGKWVRNEKTMKFYLDDSYKSLEVDTGLEGIGKIKLGELWNNFNKGKYKHVQEEVQETLRAVVLRVPMDSVSGANALTFGGFTGRKGHGIFMHGISERKLGGADKDGDEAFVYFGGKGGFTKQVKDWVDANYGEYHDVNKKGEPMLMDNKGDVFKKLLTITPGSKAEADYQSSLAAKYSPSERLGVAERVPQGRFLLGGNANNKQIIAAAYSSLLAKGKPETIKVEMRGKEYEIEVTPKTSEKDKQFARLLASSEVAFSADPMDVYGLKDYFTFNSALVNAHFNITPKTKVPPAVKKALQNKAISKLFKEGTLGNVRQANSAIYGRNWEEGRRFTQGETNRLLEPLEKMSTDNPEAINTFLTKVGRMVKDIDITDNVFHRINKDKLSDLYSSVRDNVKKYDYLKNIMERKSFNIPSSEIVEGVMSKRLYNSHIRSQLADNPSELKAFLEPFIKKGGRSLVTKEKIDEAMLNKNKAETLLEDVVKFANDAVINDVYQMNTTTLVDKVVKSMYKKELNKVSKIHAETERIKKDNYLKRKDRGRIGRFEQPTDEYIASVEAAEAWNKANPNNPMEIPNKILAGEKASTQLDQFTIDSQIDAFKKNLTAKQKKLFDFMLLGNLNRGDLAKLEKFESEAKIKNTPELEKLLKQERWNASRTSTSEIGFNSQAVSQSNIKEFIGGYLQNFQKAKEAPMLSTSKLMEVGKNPKESLPEVEHAGDIAKMTEFDPKRGIRGLIKGKMRDLSPEMQSTVSELLGHLKHYNNKNKHNFGEIVGGILNKELNTLNFQDYKTLNRYFKDLRNGSIWQRLFKDKAPTIQKRFYWLFPNTVNREMMKYEIDWLVKEGLVLTKEGTMKPAKVAEPTWYLSKFQHFIHKVQQQGDAQADSWINDLRKEHLFLGNVAEGEQLRQIAVRKRELNLSRKDGSTKEQLAELQKNYNTLLKEYGYDKLRAKKYIISEIDGKRVEITGEQVVDRVNEGYNRFYEKMYNFVSGKGSLTDKQRVPEALKKFIKGYHDKEKTIPRIDYIKFLKHLEKAYVQNKDVSYEFGVDGLRMVQRSMLAQLSKELDSGLFKAIKERAFDPTGVIDFKAYWPRMHHNPKRAVEALKKEIEIIKETSDKEMSKEEKNNAIANILYKKHSLTGDWHFEEMNAYEQFDGAFDAIIKRSKKAKEHIKWFKSNQKMGSMFKRTGLSSEYSIDATVPETYARNLANVYSKHLSQIYSRGIIDKFYKTHSKKWGKDLTNAWGNYFKLYVNDALGNPVNIPDRVFNDPNMKLKGTPYAWWADDKVTTRVNKIAKKLGVVKEDLPEGLEAIDVNRMRHWSNLEAQFQMASLLAHPKSMVANIFGGTMHTIESAGFSNLINGKKLSYLQKINPKWKSKEDINEFVLSHGVIPEYIAYEAGLSKEVKSAKAKDFIKDFTRKLTRHPDMQQSEVVELAKKHGVTDAVRNFAAKFLTIPEKALRRDAFMAHYVAAWERFNGSITDPNHPFLIESAKKGVQATQFLYSAPFRPAFSRTALGKVMTRFQLWSWNSVRFRNDILRDAKIHGFRQGTPEFEKFKRTAQIDLMVFALSNAFMYSLFETALPAPWNWFQDTGEWLFGDEKARDRAFFGAWPKGLEPLQMVTPPILRLGPPALRAMLDDDYKKLSQYYIWTMFPFGRLARDVVGPGNVIDNPIRAISKFTGMPLLQAQRAQTARRQEVESGEFKGVPTPGGSLY